MNRINPFVMYLLFILTVKMKASDLLPGDHVCGKSDKTFFAYFEDTTESRNFKKVMQNNNFHVNAEYGKTFR